MKPTFARSTALAAALTATAALALPLAGSAQIAFTDVSAQAGVAHRGESYGASWGDLNNDGLPDLFASNHRQRPSLFLNVGNGTFLDTGAQVLPWRNRSGADTHGASWAYIEAHAPGDVAQQTQIARQGVGVWNQLLLLALLAAVVEPWFANRLAQRRAVVTRTGGTPS